MTPASIRVTLPAGTPLGELYGIPYFSSIGRNPSERLKNSSSTQNVRSRTGSFATSDNDLTLRRSAVGPDAAKA